ncbi:a1-alpha2 repression [Phlyctochytrium planicorne]|nr:a1-alpha2 repression [Phlyctochytrium planicorne]
MDISPENAKALFAQGAFLITMDSPNNLEFGIDLNEWEIGPKFKGMKLIPPGLHFYFYSPKAGATSRIGVFKFFELKEVVLKKWDVESEDFMDEENLDPEYVKSLKSALRELDSSLGAYPLLPTAESPEPTYKKWIRLTRFITPKVLFRILPKSGKVTGSSCTSRFTEVEAIEADSIFINFAAFDLRRSFPPGATPDLIMKYSIDKSYLLQELISGTFENDYRMLLGELQLSYILLLSGHIYDGLEQWKALLTLLSNSPEAIQTSNATLFNDLLDVIDGQLRECPEDFFTDALLSESFLLPCITHLLYNLQESGGSLPIENNIAALKKTLRDRFKLDINDELRRYQQEKEDDEEYANVVVEFEHNSLST